MTDSLGYRHRQESRQSQGPEGRLPNLAQPGRAGGVKEENRALRARQETLASEKTSLLHRNEQVRTRVEAMIGRLKSMEHSA